MMGMAINIQKVNFDDDNRIQNFEKTQETTLNLKKKMISSRKVITAINKERKSSANNFAKNNIRELPDLQVINMNGNGNGNLNNNKLPEIDSNEDNTNIPLVKSYPKVKRTINSNNLGLKVKRINFFTNFFSIFLNIFRFLQLLLI